MVASITSKSNLVKSTSSVSSTFHITHPICILSLPDSLFINTYISLSSVRHKVYPKLATGSIFLILFVLFLHYIIFLT